MPQQRRGGPQPRDAGDWLFGYRPRRRLLRALYGPSKVREPVPKTGFSAARLAQLADKGRDAIPDDLTAMESLGLLEKRRVGKRDRYWPLPQAPLASPLEGLIDALERTKGPPTG